MSPNMICDAFPSFSPRLTVAKKKEALELRKTMKPLMEKRRRARINESLNHLKNLILPLTGRDKTRYSKLEKADILDMTVRFLGEIPPIKAKGTADSYREGYKACLQRVSTLLPKSNLDQEASVRVNEFVQRSLTANDAPSCLSCCAQKARAFPRHYGKPHTLKSIGSRQESQSHRPTAAAAASRAQQPGSAGVWRPW